MTELALPAGSLQAALVAFNEGADATYLGMRNFSARKEATNFSLEDLSKLRQFANEHNKKIYVTVNTLIDDEQISEVVKTLRQIAFIGCDGIIVQDLGVARIVKNQFPSLSLHGSTQLAVHTIEGVRELERLGFSRVVLARELTLEEIQTIREACPNIELKVFIHGSLCYGFSGLCTASEQLCGRSANCGACAQICRSWFALEADPSVHAALSPTPEGKETGWYFSMSDLKAGDVAKTLQDMGIDSLKVEGRMKGPAYTLAASRYYRAVLDGSATEEEKQALDESLSIVFARRQTKGWLGDYGRVGHNFEVRTAPTLGSTSFPSHRGVPAAKIKVVKKDYAIVTALRDIAIRDGLMYYTKGKKDPIEAIKFGLSGIFDQKGKSLAFAYKGETVEVDLPRNEELPHAGEMLYLISLHDQNPALVNENIPTTKFLLDTQVEVLEKDLVLTTAFKGNTICHTYEIEVAKAQKDQDLQQHLVNVFSKSDTSYFGLGELAFENKTGLEDNQVFLPLSWLKAIRRDWYSCLDNELAKWMTADEQPAPAEEKLEVESLPSREKLCTKEGLPYLDLSILAKQFSAGKKPEGILFFENNLFYLPLSPVIFGEEQFFKDLDTVVSYLRKEGYLEKTRFGLNNIGQLEWARSQKDILCFIDIYLYLGNAESAKMAVELLPNLAGGYLWMERDHFQEERWPFTPTLVGSEFTPPLFISRSCFRHDSLMLSCEGCPLKGSWYVKQQNHRYHVMVNDCITTVVKA
ncbi:peptidase U32 family protein [Sphaerochaeta sp. PS]|uniref:peptidase U32 family protein n=1 Tax=Sphaerochaeta sp. PS TaxID=3076336 RepID=UPI0028A3ABE6|nr:peptidase U32 family protein [Sphaerochaeta sp. PS]MDT4761064.1 peptidase U32 family protein [Sphaerochaeta sp. PS]